jgi:hypothetical protein
MSHVYPGLASIPQSGRGSNGDMRLECPFRSHLNSVLMYTTNSDKKRIWVIHATHAHVNSLRAFSSRRLLRRPGAMGKSGKGECLQPRPCGKLVSRAQVRELLPVKQICITPSWRFPRACSAMRRCRGRGSGGESDLNVQSMHGMPCSMPEFMKYQYPFLLRPSLICSFGRLA